MTYHHVTRATDYARAVVAGDVLACKWVVAACRRHLDDLARSQDQSYPFRFDATKAERVCRFLELLPHVKGRWARENQRMRLEPWQAFVTCCMFGWVQKSDGLRRFRKAFLLIPRKNGKSFLAAGWGLWMLAMDDEHGAEVYSGATTEKQAWEIFRPARLMVMKTPQFAKAAGIGVSATTIFIESNASRFETIIGNPGDGSSPSCAIHDEYHEHDSDDQASTMETGMGARDQPLQIFVSTAGDNLSGPCYQTQLDAQKVLDGAMANDRLFAIVYTIDKGDDWTKDEALQKANPNFGVSVSAEFLRAQRDEAKASARKQGAFRTKHLNEWVASRSAYFNVQRWIEAADPSLKLEDFKGSRAILALDLASKIDIAALEILIMPDDKRRVRFGRYYLPEATIQAPENDHYRGWEIDGWITKTDGEIINFHRIKDDILALCDLLDVEAVAYDPHQATMLVTDLMESGVPVVEFRPTVLNFSEPMKSLDAMIIAKQLEHDGDPVMTWMVSNVTARIDAKDNVYPRKERFEDKIDGVIASIMAVGIMTSMYGKPKLDLDEWLKKPVTV